MVTSLMIAAQKDYWDIARFLIQECHCNVDASEVVCVWVCGCVGVWVGGWVDVVKLTEGTQAELRITFGLKKKL